ncbi:hypothetical protein [Rhizorhapis sp.]|uniref:hypothetical protein n=1 Tax=Rhizorhapis sp. TaxID=1968842 RepID=UPI002B458D90|nr:hypothetical protein [Rhizorhapis sp.]HKR16618.1 hypothetical protein [Rhizorhapis sp.]
MTSAPKTRSNANRRAERRRKLDENAPALIAAIKLQQGVIAKAEAAIPPLQVPLAAASLRLIAEVQGDALNETRKGIEQLAPALARLIAADHVMAGTVGTSGFPVPPGAPLPIKGSLLVERLIKAIPDALMPDALKAENLAAAARAISAPIISKVKGTKND